MHDDQLREHFTSWARPLQAARPPALPVLRRRARRRAARQATAGGLAVLGIAAVIAVSVSGPAGHAPPAVPTLRGVPHYAVILKRGGQTVSVVDMATGKVVGQAATPTTRSDFQWAAAAADDRTFAFAVQISAAADRFYLLHLAADGTPGRLTPVHVPPLRPAEIYGMALTADASRLAVAWQNYPSGPVISRISVITLATGATRTWTSAHGSASAVSWAGDHALAFAWQDLTQGRSSLRLLDTTAAGTSLLDSRLLIHPGFRAGALSGLGSPLITQDGSTVFATMNSGAKTVIVRLSARTGKLQAVLTPPVRTGDSPNYCGVLWTDPHGRHLITQCGTSQASVVGDRATPIRPHQLIPASPVGFANTSAW